MNIAERDKDKSEATRAMFDNDNRIRVFLGLKSQPLPEWLTAA